MTKRISFLVFVLSLLAVSTTAQSKLLPGMPAPLDMSDIYSADRPGALNPVVKNFVQRVYVPNTESNTVSVIDPTTYKVIETFQVGRQPQHVTPSYDMTKLWILNDKGNSLTAIDPATGKMGETVPVDDPYNMYYTPDGKYAIVVAEQMKRLMFRERKRMALKEVFRSSTSRPKASSRNGSCPAAEARTWAGSPPMAKCSGLPADTTPRSMPSIPMTAISSRKFQSERALTGFACIRSREGT